MKKIYLIVFAALITFANLAAQSSPFIFTMTPEKFANNNFNVNFESAYGQKTFLPMGVDDLEQNIGFHTNIFENVHLLDRTGIAFTNGSTKFSQQIELLRNFLNTSNNDILDLSAGLGYVYEFSEVNVMISRFMLGKQFENWQLYSNVLLEHAFAENRDAVDLTTSIGFAYNIANNIKLGFEAVGQDLEGFWEIEEAEGGAQFYIGPSLSFAIPESILNITLGGGAIIRATNSELISQAQRPIPIVKGNGYIVRGLVSLGF